MDRNPSEVEDQECIMLLIIVPNLDENTKIEDTEFIRVHEVINLISSG